MNIQAYKSVFISIILGFSLLTPVMAMQVHAQEDDNSEEQSTEEDSATDERGDRLAQREDRQAERETREQERRERLDAIDEERATRAAERCEMVVSKVVAAAERAQTAQDNHSTAITGLSSKLANLSTRLAASGIDTARLDEQITNFETSANAILANFDLFIAALDDAAQFDCSSGEIEDLLLAVDDAKAIRTTIQDDLNTLKQLTRENIIVLLDDIKSQLGEDATDGEES